MAGKEQKKAKFEGQKVQVTLVQRDARVWDVLDLNGKPLLCECGRPVEATLHNVSVEKQLGPCSQVVLKLNNKTNGKD